MKKYLFSILFILFLTSCTNLAAEQSLSNNITDDNASLPNIQMIVKLDKSVYHSYEEVNLSINLLGDHNIQDLLITAKGIESRLNKYYFDQSQLVSLYKGLGLETQLRQILPSCNSCSGLVPGNYDINVSATYQGRVLASEKISLSIKQ